MEIHDFATHEESIPTLIKYISTKEVAGFDSIAINTSLNSQKQPSEPYPFSSSPMVCYIIPRFLPHREIEREKSYYR